MKLELRWWRMKKGKTFIKLGSVYGDRLHFYQPLIKLQIALPVDKHIDLISAEKTNLTPKLVIGIRQTRTEPDVEDNIIKKAKRLLLLIEKYFKDKDKKTYAELKKELEDDYQFVKFSTYEQIYDFFDIYVRSIFIYSMYITKQKKMSNDEIIMVMNTIKNGLKNRIDRIFKEIEAQLMIMGVNG